MSHRFLSVCATFILQMNRLCRKKVAEIEKTAQSMASWSTMEQQQQTTMTDALVTLGSYANVADVFQKDPARFRLEFTNDQKTKELRWVLFTGLFRRMELLDRA